MLLRRYEMCCLAATRPILHARPFSHTSFIPLVYTQEKLISLDVVPGMLARKETQQARDE